MNRVRASVTLTVSHRLRCVREGVAKGHMPLMLCTVREALLIREGARHRVSRGKEVSATWRGRKKRKKRCWLGWAVWVVPTKDTLKGEEVTQSESSEIESFTQKSAAFEYYLSGPVKSFFFLQLLFSSIITFFLLGILYFIFISLPSSPFSLLLTLPTKKVLSLSLISVPPPRHPPHPPSTKDHPGLGSKEVYCHPWSAKIIHQNAKQSPLKNLPLSPLTRPFEHFTDIFPPRLTAVPACLLACLLCQPSQPAPTYTSLDCCF